MSQAPGASIGISMAEAQATIELLAPAVVGALGQRFFDATDHHRRSVLKYHKLPAGRGGQKFLAAGLHRYGSKTRFPTKFADLVGESFAAAATGTFYGEDAFSLLEKGGPKSAGDYFAVPVFANGKTGAARTSAVAKFKRMLEAGDLQMVGKKTRYLVSREALERGGKRAVQILGVLVKRRSQRPQIDFYGQWEKVYPKHVARMEADLALAMTEAGRKALAFRVDGKRRASEEYGRAFRASLAGGANATAAKAAAKAAALAVRARGGTDA